MQVIKKETVTEEREVVADILCNRCGKSCCPPSLAENDLRPEYYGLIEAQITGGYFSPTLGDMCAYQFSLCEHCLAWLFAFFTITALVDEDAYPTVGRRPRVRTLTEEEAAKLHKELKAKE